MSIGSPRGLHWLSFPSLMALLAGCGAHTAAVEPAPPAPAAAAPAATAAAPATPAATAPAPAATAVTPEPPKPATPPGPPIPPPASCPNCRPLFDGKTLDGWAMEKPGSFVVRDGAIASTGPGSHLWTREELGDYRLFFSVRQVGNEPGKGHRPSVTFMGKTPDPAAPKFPRGLFGVQLQPPHGGAWDYRPGQEGDPKKNPQRYQRPDPRPKFDDKRWHRCEVLVKGSEGAFTAACCDIEGRTSCQAVQVLAFKDPALAGARGPIFCIQIHNSGLYDEFKDIYVDDKPTSNELLTLK